ncbi:MAG: MFS transporter, partial [Actinomycetota bacterium]|nr:MFS transporter [Actinomycetota bacterium]
MARIGASSGSTSRRALLRNRSLLALLARDVISVTGSQMTWLALPWFVLTTTGSASRMAVVLAVESASLAIFGFLGGNVVTRLGPRRTMLVADAARAPLVALVPLLHALDALSFPLLLVLVAAISAFATPSFASKTSILPDLVGEDEAVLGEANALLQGASRITMIAGPALAGTLIAVIGATNVLLVDAVTFAVGFALVARFVRGGDRVEHDEESRSLLAGLRFVARHRLLRPWTATLVVGDVAWLVMFAAMPVLVLARFGEEPQLLGWIWGGWGLGAVLGSVVAFRIVAGVDRLLLASVGEIFMIAPLWLLLADIPAA